MIHGLNRNRMRWVVASLLLVSPLAGCSSSSRYPKELRYQPRTDLLVTGKPSADPRELPPPGKLEEGIKASGAPAVDPLSVPEKQRTELTRALFTAFGTPSAPRVDLEALGVDETAEVANLQIDDVTLRRGSELYRRHCLHCHGVNGDGRGPTGPWVHPHPRDYRQGTFKFRSSTIPPETVEMKPRRSDLYRTLVKGIDGTSMPAFGLLPEEELQALVSYVIHLSIRGEVEYNLIRALAELKGEEPDKPINEKVADEGKVLVARRWAPATALPPSTPPPYPYKEDGSEDAKNELRESVRRGYNLFIGEGICITCHFDFGRQSSYKYDVWGTLAQPRNLTQGNYRGGRRPLDIYYRLTNGILPSQMPVYAPGLTAAEKKLPQDQQTAIQGRKYWDLVNFVQALPYPAMLPKDVREKVYGSSMKQAKPEDKTHASR